MKTSDLKKLISVALNVNEKKINENSSFKNIPEWDSLGHLSILSSLDKKTKGKTSKMKELSETMEFKKINKILLKNKIIKN
jgi:acyl carrier protein